ncbi:MAG: ribosome biogenesis GTPase Der [Candidatus Magasanikbacteria bacterium]|nr:ribosome biogenesis GTPase Der [Candidatus Magasanikbacteria bacterium]
MSTPAIIITPTVPTVALVGRVNVGKSTLFNRIIEAPLAIVSEVPGTTRTRNIALATWRGRQFRLIDTGGLTFDRRIPLEEEVIKQTEIAVREADLIIFVTDIREGILPQEKQLAKQLRRLAARLPVILVANKADSAALATRAAEREWRSLGLGAPRAISAVTGRQVGDLLDVIYEQLKKRGTPPRVAPEVKPLPVAIVGRPNVGKSSLFNRLIGEERVIVSALPHTTREPHDTLVEVEGEPILFIDTAGIRRKAKVGGELERLGIQKSLEAIKRSLVVLLLLDASEPITDQDQQLGGLLREQTKSAIIVLNKWDTAVDNSDRFRNEVKKMVYGAFPHLSFAPVVFVSAKTGYRVAQIFPLIQRAAAARHTELTDQQLGDWLARVTKKHRPTRGKGVRHPKILGMTQLRADPPMFDIRIKAKTSLHISYVHFLANRLREERDFFATPIIIKLSKMKR